MGWAAIGKAVGGAVKGGAKKIATNKLLGRGKKKPQKPQAEGGEYITKIDVFFQGHFPDAPI